MWGGFYWNFKPSEDLETIWNGPLWYSALFGNICGLLHLPAHQSPRVTAELILCLGFFP